MHKEKILLGKRRDRAIAKILYFKESNCDHLLDEETSQDLREVILDEINDVCDFAFDLIDGNIVFNEEFLDRLESIMRS